jgi:PPP family 3-phenylpropionic acid transporter
MAAPLADTPYWRLSIFFFFYFAFFGGWVPYWPLFLKDAGFSAPQIAALAAVMSITKIIGPNVWGILADRNGQRMKIIRLGAMMGFLIFLATFFSLNFWWLVLIVACYSFFWNAILSQFDVVTLAHLGGRYQYYSRIRMWGSIGFVVVVAGLGVLFDFIAISHLQWILALLLLAIWISSYWVSDATDQHIGKKAADISENKTVVQSDALLFWKSLLRPEFLVFYVSVFLMQASHGPYYTFFTIYLEQYSYSRTQIGLLVSLGVIAEILLFWMMHKVLARFSLRQIVIASLALASVRWFLIGSLVDVLWILLLAQLFHAATFASFHAFGIEFVRQRFPDFRRGRAMAVYSGFSYGGGGVFGALMSGWLWVINPHFSFFAASLATLLGVWLAWKYIDRNDVNEVLIKGS